MTETLDTALMFDTARRAAHVAGDLLRRSFGRPLVVKETFLHDVKIELDRQCQDSITDLILAEFPSHCILGEEGNLGSNDAEVEWIVDPIDGTMNLLHSVPHFCISIAARQRSTGQIVLGIIHDPLRDEWFTAIRGHGAWLNGSRMRVSDRNKLSDAVLAVGFAKTQESIDHCLELYRVYGSTAKKLRAMGSAALDLAYVASGRFDAYIEQGVNIWDVAAGWILVEEAGGVMEVEVRPSGALKICASSGKIVFTLK